MIRFQRIGRKNDAAFRIVVTEKTSGPKSGKHVDLIGSYNPKTKAVSIDAKGVQKWIANGAQVSPSVHNLFVKEGVISGKKVNVLPKKRPIIKESTEESAKAKESTAEKEEPKMEATDTKQKEQVIEEEKAPETNEQSAEQSDELAEQSPAESNAVEVAKEVQPSVA